MRRERMPYILGAVFAALFVARALPIVLWGGLNSDEGWYLYAAREVYRGKLPYIDFPYFQGPLLPYVYGLPQLWAPPGSRLLVGRLTSLALGLFSFILAAQLGYKLGGPWGQVVSMALLTSCKPLLWVFSTTRTEPLVAALTIAGLHALVCGRETLAACVMSCAVGTRLSCLPAVLFVWALALRRTRRKLTLAVLAPVPIVILLALPMVAAPERTLFNLIGSQMARHTQLGADIRETPYTWAATRGLIAVVHPVRYYPGFAILAMALAPLAARHARTFQTECALAAMAALLYFPNLAVPCNIQEIYLAPSFAVLAPALGGATCKFALGSKQPAGGTTGISANELRPLLACFTIAAILLQATTSLYYTRPDIDRSSPQLEKLREVAAYLGPPQPGKHLVTFDTYVAVEAGWPVPPGFEMNYFSLFPGMNDGQATRLGVLSPGLYRKAVRDPDTQWVLLTDFDPRMIIERGNRERGCTYQPLSEQELLAMIPELQGLYRLERVVADFGQWHDNLYIFRRVDHRPFNRAHPRAGEQPGREPAEMGPGSLHRTRGEP